MGLDDQFGKRVIAQSGNRGKITVGNPFRAFELADMIIYMTQGQVNNGAVHRADIGRTRMY